MTKLHEQYITDEKGIKKAIVISVSEWQKIIDELEELEDIRAYDEVKVKPSNPIPFKDAVNEIRKG